MAVEEQLQGAFNIIFAGGVNWDRVGQVLTISNRMVARLAFKTARVGSPTGTITFTIRKVSDDSVIVSKVYGSAGSISTTADFIEVIFDTPVLINEQVRILMEWSGALGDGSNYLEFWLITSDVKASENVVRYFGGYTSTATWDATYRYTYASATDSLYEVRVDWNNDTDFNDANEDISEDVLTRQGPVLAYDRGTEDPDSDRAPVGIASFTVRNVNGKYSPENGASPLSPNVKPRRRIRVRALFNGVLYDLWKGYIVKYVPDPSPRPPHGPTCAILCEDGMGWLGHPESRIDAPEGSPLNSVKLGANPGPLKAILDAAGWPAADRDLNEGVDRIGPWWVKGQTPRDAIQDLMKMEGSLAFIAPDGKFTYRDRHARIKGDGLVSQATFSNNGRDLGYEYGQESIINKAIVTGLQQEAATASTYVYGLLDFPRVEPAETLEIWVELDSSVSGITTPAANVDWKANLLRDGSGTDQTANVAVVADQIGQVVRLRITNNYTRAVWIVPGTSDDAATLRIRGTVYTEAKLQRQDSDAASITAHQQRSFQVDTLFIGSHRRLASQAKFIVADRKDPRALSPRLTVLSNSDILRATLLTLDVGDRITLTVTSLGITSQAYHINKASHRVWNGGVQHEVTYWLAKVGLENFWRIGVSQVGVDTRLAF